MNEASQRAGRARDAAEALARRVHDEADELFSAARSHAEDFRDRLDSGTRDIRGRAGRFVTDAEAAIEGRTGLLSAARNHPLPALGIAFALGYLFAGDDEEGSARHPAAAVARNQLRGAVLAGISAAVSSQVRSYLEQHGGIGGLLASLGMPVPGEGAAGAAEPGDDELG